MRTRDISRLEWVANIAEAPILDVGCGDSPYFHESIEFTAVDIDPDSEDMQRGKPDNFVEADAKDLPFDDNEFKTVVLAEILEHMDNPIAALMEARRVSGDKVLITVPDENRWGPKAKPGDHEGHKRRYDGRMLFDQCKKAGFPEADIQIDYLNDGDFCFWLANCEVFPDLIC